MQIGRRLYYDAISGIVVCDTGERQGAVAETIVNDDFTVFPQLSGRTTANTKYVEYAFGDARFANDYATAHIDPPTQSLTTYPWATIAASKTQVTANGADSAMITVSGLTTADVVNFSVNGGASNPVTPTNGQAQMTFKTQVAGVYTIQAQTAKNGTLDVQIQGV